MHDVLSIRAPGRGIFGDRIAFLERASPSRGDAVVLGRSHVALRLNLALVTALDITVCPFLLAVCLVSHLHMWWKWMGCELVRCVV